MSKGFTNLGNTCYMNSALQCLSHLPHFNPENDDFIIDCTKRLKKNDYTLMQEWFKLLREMWITDNSIVINTAPLLKEFMKQCIHKNIFFESFMQNDAQEFITIFVDLLHDSIKRRVRIEISGEPKNKYDLMKIESIKSWKSFFESNYSYIIKHFYSKLTSTITCPECNYHTDNYEPISVITLSLNTNYKDFYDCLDEFVKPESLDTDNSWKCDQCKKNVCPQKKMKFFELPSILIFSIKQFRKGRKIDHHIDFPEYLNMDKYCMNLKKDNLNYRLSGVCIHSGGLGGGHYYAMCYNYTTGEWAKHNDTHVSTVSLEKVLQETPYCFFYVRG